ncbi:hypothetical protein ACLOJK_006109 [Asimina triloba]
MGFCCYSLSFFFVAIGRAEAADQNRAAQAIKEEDGKLQGHSVAVLYMGRTQIDSQREIAAVHSAGSGPPLRERGTICVPVGGLYKWRTWVGDPIPPCLMGSTATGIIPPKFPDGTIATVLMKLIKGSDRSDLPIGPT